MQALKHILSPLMILWGLILGLSTVANIAYANDKIKVAMLVPLTGDVGHIGRDFLDAAQIALFDVSSIKIELLPYDTKGTNEGARMAAEAAVADKVNVILGPFLSRNIASVKSAIGWRGIPMLSFSNNAKALWAVGGADTWLTGFLPRQQLRDLLSYAKSMGRSNLAVYSPNNAYGRLVIELTQSIADELGINLVIARTYDPTETDFAEQIKEFTDYNSRYGQYKTMLSELREFYKSPDNQTPALAKRIEWLEKHPELPQPAFDMVLIPALSEIVLRAIVAQLAFYEVDTKQVKVLGLQSWDDFAGITAEPSLRGAWFVAPDREERQKFAHRFAKAHGRQPHRLASLGWDAMALVSVLGARHGSEGLSKQNLTNVYGFQGVDGIFRLRDNGLVERPEAIYEIMPRGVEIIKPAPLKFKNP